MDYEYHYQKWHPDTAEHRKQMLEYLGRFLENRLEGIQRGPAIDIGCGTGYLMQFLMAKGFKPVSGFDISESQIKACQKLGLDVALCEDIVDSPAVENAPFSLITAFDVLEHLKKEKAEKMVKNSWKLLAPDGVFMCTVPNANSALAARMRYIDYTHTTCFTEHSLDHLLYDAGFRKIRIIPGEVSRTMPSLLHPLHIMEFLNFKIMRAFRRLECMAELGKEGRKIPLSLNLLALAKR